MKKLIVILSLCLVSIVTFCQTSVSDSSKWSAIPMVGVVLNQSNTNNFIGCDFEHNGTSGNLSTGSINITNATQSTEVIAVNFKGCWFEQNYGSQIKIDEPYAKTRSNIDGCTFVTEQTGCVDLNVTGATHINDVLVIGTDLITVNATGSNCTIHCIDSAITTSNLTNSATLTSVTFQ